MGPGSATPRPWYDSWLDAATGPDGFWRHSRVREAFRTASHSALLADAIAALLSRPDYADVATVVEIGAGDGLLLDGLRARQPRRRFIGVDVRPRPAGIIGVDWCTGTWDVRTSTWRGSAADLLTALPGPTMIICAEWLDDLPCPIADGAPTGSSGRAWRSVQVRADGAESLGPAVAEEDADWLRRWWPSAGDGAMAAPTSASTRAECGRPRDRAWAALVTALRRSGGAALMIDYGHLRAARPRAGTLTGYAAGRQVAPRPDAAINLTAHVAVDAVAAAGEHAGARTSLLLDQRTAVRRLLPAERVATDPDPLAELQRRGERRLLTDTLGNHLWLLQDVPPAGPRNDGP